MIFTNTDMLKKSTFLLLLACTTLLCCQTNGQSGSDKEQPPPRPSAAKAAPSWRRPVPPEILATLPKTADRVKATAHFVFLSFGKTDLSAVEQLAAELENNIASLSEAFALPGNASVKIYLYPSSEIKGLLRRNNSRSEIDSTGTEVHLVLNEMYAAMAPFEPLELFLRQTLGSSNMPALTCGLAITYTPTWQRLGYQQLSARLAAAELLPDLSELLNMELWSTYSDLVAECLTASFVEFLRQTLPPEQFIEVYKNATLEELQQYERDWKAWLKREATAARTPPKKPLPPYLKGFNFAHEGYQIYNGYGSRLALQSLEDAKRLGSNAVAIVPYSFLRNANEPTPIPVARFAGGENDEAVMASCYQARSLGLYTLLKPQIWLGRGQWPGDIEMVSEKEWNLFFKYYTYWIVHYALLAEVHQVDGLCLGTEMSKTTSQRPADWRFLIDRIRKLYSGHLTYAANWGNEFEQLSFWDALDYIGLNCYYPLSDLPAPTDQDLRSGLRKAFSKAAAVSKKFNKPVVLTEVGFPTARQPWLEPHRDGKGMTVDYKAQARCFRLMFEELQNQAWCGGILIWKWPSYRRDYHGERATFHINGHPAEQVIRNWYQHPQSN